LPIAPDEKVYCVNVHATIGGAQVLEGYDYSVDYTTAMVTVLTVWDAVPGTLDILCAAIANLSITPIPDTTVSWTPLAYGTNDPAYAGLLAQTGYLDRPIELTIDADGFGTPYVYP
jgi:hypothetical protein